MDWLLPLVLVVLIPIAIGIASSRASIVTFTIFILLSATGAIALLTLKTGNYIFALNAALVTAAIIALILLAWKLVAKQRKNKPYPKAEDF